MGFIKQPLHDAKEPEAAPEGMYDLRIVKADDGESKKGNQMTTVFIKIEDPNYPNASLVRHWITYISNDTPADQRQMRLLDQRRFLQAFGVPYEANGFNSDDLLGQTARCMLKQEEGDDGTIYNRLVLPRLKA
jgi:hypothetical protein